MLVPSRSESFGLVALEAAACGTPVVAAAVGGLLTLVDHGHTGFLVAGRDPEVFASYTDEILGNDRLAGGDGTWRRRQRSRRYTWSLAAARLRRVYADLTVGALVECHVSELFDDGALGAARAPGRRVAAPDGRRPTRSSPPSTGTSDAPRRWFVRMRGEEKDITTVWFTSASARCATRPT